MSKDVNVLIHVLFVSYQVKSMFWQKVHFTCSTFLPPELVLSATNTSYTANFYDERKPGLFPKQKRVFLPTSIFHFFLPNY